MDKKECSRCEETKPYSAFYKCSNNPDGLRYWCKECYSEYRKDNSDKYKKYYREWRKNNKEKVKEYKRKHRDKLDKFINSQKDKCVKCGETRTYVLDFHHKDSNEKEYNVSELRDCNKKTARKEINKCVVLCANCHREFHHFKKNDGISIDSYVQN